ncbi:MAG TPA: hypothetical protein PLM63_02480 [bacterium]|nr:hypothetical protein [Patescibacteria group bacterium]HOC96557.1 hypothetical protein [bacterium]HPO11423.1 hypothetical protein [bacterium]HQL12077.1 hypothetical protein [bacterium]
MKKILIMVFVLVMPCIFAQTHLPAIQFLYVHPNLEGGIVISNENNYPVINDFTVHVGGKTFVRLVEHSIYIIEKDGKFYYPNGDLCPVGKDGRAIYLGDNKWINTCYQDQDPKNIKKIAYQVIWP